MRYRIKVGTKVKLGGAWFGEAGIVVRAGNQYLDKKDAIMLKNIAKHVMLDGYGVFSPDLKARIYIKDVNDIEITAD